MQKYKNQSINNNISNIPEIISISISQQLQSPTSFLQNSLLAGRRNRSLSFQRSAVNHDCSFDSAIVAQETEGFAELLNDNSINVLSPFAFNYRTKMVTSLFKHSQLFIGIVLLVVLSSCSSSIRFTSGASGSSTSGKYNSGNISTNSHTGYTHTTPTIGTISKSKEPIPVGEVQNGLASYYGGEFNGKLTASGTVFDQNQLTAAHRTLPFGSKVQVTNQKNGRKVVVAIVDRGPFKDDRIIDLSTAAAESIDMIKDGVVQVELKVIE